MGRRDWVVPQLQLPVFPEGVTHLTRGGWDAKLWKRSPVWQNLTPSLAWYRKLIAQKFDGSKQRS